MHEEQKWSKGFYEEKLSELVLQGLEKKTLQGDLIAALQYVNGAHKKARDNLSSRTVAMGKGVMVLN